VRNYSLLFIINLNETEGSFFMLQQFFHQSAWAFVLEAATIIGILTKIGSIVHYNRLVHETEQMERVHTRWIKALKKRFESYGQLQFKVENAESFVDKYMEMDRICGLKSRVFIKIPRICMILILLAACQGRESWIFITGLNLVGLLGILEVLMDVSAVIPTIRTNLLLSIEKGSVKNRNNPVVKPKKEKVKLQEEIAVSEEKDLLSQEEVESFGKILKEWWEF
jgi:hypothetical protein